MISNGIPAPAPLLQRYVQCKADPFQNLNRGLVIPPLKLGREWIDIFHSFVHVYLPLHVSNPNDEASKIMLTNISYNMYSKPNFLESGVIQVNVLVVKSKQSQRI